ncbi:MAG TPA: hypothetical protein ENJ32_04870 [Crenotrichaceae bacterium]|nr:hypothetical protein [Crenotrichaceae bacterium]
MLDLVITQEKQHVYFIDPKGLRQIHGFDDPKIKFHKTIKDIQNRLADPDIILDSFIISNTYQREMEWWKRGSQQEQTFQNNHVLFQKENKNSYIGQIFESF